MNSKFISIIEEYTKDNIIIAFSGGVDSALLLKMACICAEKNNTTVYAVTVQTELHPMNELEESIELAKEYGAVHKVIKMNELEAAGIENNPENRCYLCKKYLFMNILDMAKELGIKTIMDGTNADDMKVYRPGVKALSELGIKSPIRQANMSKKEVRDAALELGITVSNKPSSPCLATRFPYGTRLSYEKMHRADKAEKFIKSLGFYNIRVRVHNDIARIEIDKDEFIKLIERKDEIIAYLKSLGFVYITLDLEGFRSGSMDAYI